MEEVDKTGAETVELKLSSEILSSYKRLSYKIWYAIAEFIDNSTQAFFDNQELLTSLYAKEKAQLEIYITYERTSGTDSLEQDYLEIKDNSIGMSKQDLREALHVGNPPTNTSGRSKYGLGMKTAAFWLGDQWSIKTKKAGDPNEYIVTLDIDLISGGNRQLSIKPTQKPLEEHYTIIKIEKMHRRFLGRTIGKIKDFLASIYRFDLTNKMLSLYWNNEVISWPEFKADEFISNASGEPCKRDFEFKIDGKIVSGWAGVLSSGSRNKGGFALIQANRIIQAPPDGYKPEGIFGEQEGGRNDLVNQRLVGEIFLDGFEVSHTKDTILWEGSQEEQFDGALTKKIGDLKSIANSFRKKPLDERGPSDLEFKVAFNSLLEELMSPILNDTIQTWETPPLKVIQEANLQIKKAVEQRVQPQEIEVGESLILLYIDEEMSAYDPYVIFDATSDEKKVIIIVNKSHPFWNELEGSKGIQNYLRQCVYDGVAEWKANFKTGSLEPDTIKFIKDNLMRLPFLIEKNASSS